MEGGREWKRKIVENKRGRKESREQKGQGGDKRMREQDRTGLKPPDEKNKYECIRGRENGGCY